MVDGMPHNPDDIPTPGSNNARDGVDDRLDETAPEKSPDRAAPGPGHHCSRKRTPPEKTGNNSS